MEALRLAFETVIIGLFALPWLWIMIDLVNPGLFSSSRIKRLVGLIPKEMRPPAIGFAFFALVYLLGSMITPVAREFLNDEDMLGKYLPTAEKIQAYNYKQLGAPTTPDRAAKFEFVTDPHSKTRSDKPDSINAEFLREESTLLLRATGGSERLNRLHEQLAVLEGATFSAFALMVLCGFAWCGQCSKKRIVIDGRPCLRPLLRCSTALVVSSVFIFLAGKSLWEDVHGLESGDMPIAELVLLVLGGLGLYIAICGTRSRLKFHGLTFVFALCFTLLCYTGYGCTERYYDQEVFHTFQALQLTEGADSAHATNRTVLTIPIAE